MTISPADWVQTHLSMPNGGGADFIVDFTHGQGDTIDLTAVSAASTTFADDRRPTRRQQRQYA